MTSRVLDGPDPEGKVGKNKINSIWITGDITLLGVILGVRQVLGTPDYMKNGSLGLDNQGTSTCVLLLCNEKIQYFLFDDDF